MHNRVQGPAPRCEDCIAIDLAGMATKIAAGSQEHVCWRDNGERRQASLYMEAGGLRIEYGASDTVGRWTRTLATEVAPWHVMPLHLGGFRRWLGCPGCGRRCRALYCGGSVLRCRLCLGLKYRTQNMQPSERCAYQMHRLRSERLGEAQSDLLDFTPPRPKWMRRHTYARICARDEALAAQLVSPAMYRLMRSAGVAA